MKIRYRILNWLYKWMPVVFGCHCRDDRSFHTRGVRHPICARCEGVLVGILAAALVGAVSTVSRVAARFGLLGDLALRSNAWTSATGESSWHPGVGVLVLMLIPLILDGGVQWMTSYESGNWRRLLTGVLFGYAFFVLVAWSLAAAFRWGYEIGVWLR